MGKAADPETDYVLPIYADIMIAEFDDEDDEKETKIGSIQGKLVLAGDLMNAGQELWEICDMDSSELENVASTLFNAEGECKNVDGPPGDILYIDEVSIERAYRGHGIGLLALHSLVKSLPSFNMDTVILSPAILTSDAKGMSQAEIVSANTHLEDYWSKLGFQTWSEAGTHPVLMGLWTGNILPPIEQVVPHLFEDDE